MAIIYDLAIEFGSDKVNLNKAQIYFRNKSIILDDGRILPLKTTTIQDEDQNWWLDVWVEGMGMLGRASEDDYSLLTIFLPEITFQLYTFLKCCPIFRYALVNFEVLFFCTYHDLQRDLEDGYYDGLVLSTDLWKSFGKIKDFEPFSDQFVWKPLDCFQSDCPSRFRQFKM